MLVSGGFLERIFLDTKRDLLSLCLKVNGIQVHSPQKACFFSPLGDSSGESGIGSVGDPCMVAMVPALTAPVPTAEVALSPSDLTQ